MKRLIGFGLLCLLWSGAYAADTIRKVIQLQYRDASQVIGLIQPLLKAGDKVSGDGNLLVINVSPATLTDIRAVLHRIDVPPLTFEVSVYQGSPNWLSTQQQGGLSISTQSATEQNNYQSVQVMNGEAALISTGTNQPVVSSVGLGLWTGVEYQRRDVQNGLYVEPQMQGSQVKITLRRIREQNSQVDNQSFDQQKLATTMMLPLNKWVALGTAQGQAAAPAGVRVYSAGSSFSQQSTIYIKVNVLRTRPSVLSK